MQHRTRSLVVQAASLSAALALCGCGSPAVKSNSSGGGSPGGYSPSSVPGPGGAGSSGGPSISIPAAGSMPAPGAAPNTPTENMNCGLKRYDLERRPGDLLLILDRSGSMLDTIPVNGVPAQKWMEAVAALDAVIKKTEATVSWGLKVFPIDNACAVSDVAEVPVALNNHDKIMASVMLNASLQGARTPTREAITKGTAFMQASPSTNAKYLVVATDGEPNCAAPAAMVGDGGIVIGGRNRNGSDATATIAAVTAAAKAGIPSFIVGVATAGSEADATLNSMAIEGQRPRNNPTTKYYPVASRDELITTLDSIATQIGSCTFPLSMTPPAPQNVAVNVDGMRIAQDPSQANGWNYGPGNNSIVFFGAACDALKSGAAKDVQIIFGCGNTIIN